MVSIKNLKISNKLRLLSLISILSLMALGFVSNYFFKTSKMLGLIINAERVHNNTFEDGVEYFYKFQISKNTQWLDSAIVSMETANQMVYNFAIIDQLLERPEEEYIDVLYRTYEEGYNFDRSNAFLMASRIKLFLILKKDKLAEAQQITMGGFQLGEKIKKEIQEHRTDITSTIDASIEGDLRQMSVFYHEFASSISSLNGFANELLLVSISLIVILLVLFIALVSRLISKSIVNPVQEMVNKFRVIAKGNLKTEISVDTTNEIGNLASSFRDIQNGLREVIEYTKKVAAGDYSTQITPLSDEDEMSVALNKMVVKLKQSYDTAEQDSWFKSGINLINEKLRGDQDLDDISAHALLFMMEFLHSQLGSIHLYNPEFQFLKLVGSSGFDPKKLKGRIKLNEGIIGQVAYQKRMIILSDIPDQSYTTYSSSGEYKPNQIVVMPLLFNEILVGVLELSICSILY